MSALGGHGYLLVSGLPEMYANATHLETAGEWLGSCPTVWCLFIY